MFNKVCLVLAAAVAVCSALPRPEDRHQQYEQPLQQEFHEPQYKVNPYKEEPAKPYAFDYGVRDDYSGANYGHSETSNGNSVEGSYQVALPDGRIQIVKYVADHKNGFQAQVSYEGEARYPEHKPQQSYEPEPSYKPQQSYQPEPSYKPQPHKQPLYQQAYKSERQFQPSEPQQSFEGAPDYSPIYRPEPIQE